jgi:hypothetical protein
MTCILSTIQDYRGAVSLEGVLAKKKYLIETGGMLTVG